MKSKFYFMNYDGKKDGTTIRGSGVCNYHPFDTIRKLEEENKGSRYILLGWQEITQKEFLYYRKIMERSKAQEDNNG